MPLTPQTILLVDDHALVRAGIRSLIERIGNFEVVAEASTSAQALAVIAVAMPDIVIADLAIGTDSGLELLRTLKQRFPTLAVMVLSMHASEEMVAEALRLGAAAYLLKDAAPAELEIALRAVVRGQCYLSPAVSAKVVARYLEPAGAQEPPLHTLTARQIQILKLIAAGSTTKQIAYDLDLSEKTVAAHRAQILARLGLQDVGGLRCYAARLGLLDKSAD